MKESSFVRQNQEKWEELEGELSTSKRNPEKISRLFVQVTDDLSYAQTYYRNRSVRVYLNGAAQLLFNNIYKNNKTRAGAIVRFWKKDLPLVIYGARREFLIAFLVFIAAVFIGVLSSIYAPDFARQILGDDYIEMTMENIQKGDPMAVYKSGKELDMFLGITVNNIVVAFYTFVFGIFMGVGTIISLIRNGVMLGAFQYFFIERDLFAESFLTVWQHGTLEISSIIIAGAAGLTMSRGLLFPGTYTRMQALRLGAKRGLRIMLGIVPIFVFAAFIEGFFTRYTDAPDVIRLFVVLFSLFFILAYFVIYPRRVAGKYPEGLTTTEKINYRDKALPNLTGIQSNEQLFANTLLTLKLNGKLIFLGGLLISFIPAVLMAVFTNMLIDVSDGIVFNAERFKNYFMLDDSLPMYILNSILLALFLMVSAIASQNILRKRKNVILKNQISPYLLINSILTGFILNLPLFIGNFWGIIIQVLVMPVFMVAFYCGYNRKLLLPNALGFTFGMIGKSSGKMVFLYIKFLFLAMLIMILINPNLYWSFLNYIRWNLNMDEQTVIHIFDFIVTFIFYFAVYLCYTTIAIAMNVFYSNAEELKFATSLIGRIREIGKKKIIKGYEFDI